MEERLTLRIVTPERVTWEGDVGSLVVPAYEGQLGVWPGHAPLLAQLTPGVVKIRSGFDERLLSVSGGFIEVFRGRVSLFAETAELDEEIDEERARQAVEKARTTLKAGAPGTVDADQALAAMQRALVRLKVSELSRIRHGGKTSGKTRPSL